MLFNKTEIIELECIAPGKWSIELSSKIFKGRYSYQIHEYGRVVTEEPFEIHSVPEVKSQKLITISDFWNYPVASFFYTSPFREAFYKQNYQPQPECDANTLLLKVNSLFLTSDEILLLSGDSKALGNWNPELSPKFVAVAYGEWNLALPKETFSNNTEFKLAVFDTKTNTTRWESSLNRHFGDLPSGLFVESLYPHNLQRTFRAGGVAIPVFSLRTDENYGVGDFPSLSKMVDWAKLTGQKIIQILPINDTTNDHTWKDSYPYNAISIYALHPLYLGLNNLPLKNEEKAHYYRQKGNELNSFADVDYEQVMSLKLSYIHDLFEERGKEIIQQKDYKDFVQKNEYWLFAYACFCYLKEVNGTPKFQYWNEFSKFDSDELKKWAENPSVKEKLDKIYFTQYLLDKQLVEVKDYAHSKGIIFKGDIPIGVNPYSVDAWTDPHLFNLDTQTGAPPDDFAVLGQNWGFPTYNWEEMAKDGYLWWKKRFTKMADYFDAYRIDHILGFFRIWEIPLSAVHGLLGHFSPALPYSVDEIRWKGFYFDERHVTTPCMWEGDARSLFGDSYQEAFDNYLYSEHGMCYLRGEFATQRQIEDHFQGNGNQDLKEKLLLFCDEVLFIRDKRQPDRFHPRITPYYSKRFLSLSDDQKYAFSQLYEDFYFRRHNDFWKHESLKKLPELLHATGMLACGEDLGMIPACVPDVMNQLQILSLEIERMPKDPHQTFGQLYNVPYLSVCTTSTHDMSPIRLWWTENGAMTQRYYNEVLWKYGASPGESTPELCEQILKNHLNSPAMLVILPLQDWMSIDWEWCKRPAYEERINVPSNPNHYWRYRMQWNIEKLMENSAKHIAYLIEISNRQ